MDKHHDAIINRRLERTVTNLINHNFEVTVLERKEDVNPFLEKLIEKGSTAAVGGSMTINETDTLTWLRSGHLKFIDRYDPENDVIQKTINNDYEGYYKNESGMRKLLNYPPYGRIINIIISSENEEGLKDKAEKLYNMIKEKNSFIPKPFKAPIYRINNRYRYQIFIKSDRMSINGMKSKIKNSLINYKEKDVRISVDVDPINLL